MEEGDALLSQQFTLLAGALNDPVPAVRVAAVQAVLRVLDRYWELVPPSETATLAKTIFGAWMVYLWRGLQCRVGCDCYGCTACYVACAGGTMLSEPSWQ